MKPQITVIVVKDPPTLKNRSFNRGSGTRLKAVSWAMKNGFQVVYLVPRKQRVYAEKLSKRVDQQAKVIEQASKQLTEAVS